MMKTGGPMSRNIYDALRERIKVKSGSSKNSILFRRFQVKNKRWLLAWPDRSLVKGHHQLEYDALMI